MEQPVDKETAKAKFRSSRLSWSNQAEHVRAAVAEQRACILP